MPTSAWPNVAARVAMMILSGAVLLVASGCGDSELGSVNVPKDLKRHGPTGYGPTASKGERLLGPGPFRVKPKTKP